MARITAKNASFYLDDSSATCRAMSGRINSVTLGQSAEAPEVTSFGEGTRTRLNDGLKDYELTFDAFYDEASNQVDAILSGLIGGSTVFQLGPSGSTSTLVKYSGCVVLTDYTINLGVADAATVSMTLAPRTGSLTRTTWA